MTAAGLSSLVVEVLHNRGDDNRPHWSVGSGFFIDRRLVLTAFHNVDGPGQLLVRIHGTEEYPAVVHLQGNEDKVDLAILEVPDVVVDVPPLRYGAVDQSAAAMVEGCWAVGFPRFKEREHDPKPLRLSAQVNGEIPTGSNLDQPLLTLQVKGSPRPLSGSVTRESEWAGMSGAPVFSGNNIIVGVITEHHLPEGESALTLVPITAIDLLPKAEAMEWWKRLGVDHQALVRLPATVAPPFMPADLPAGFVPRPQEFVELKKSLLRRQGDRPTAITSALLGAGGYGKTTLALALCHDQEIQDAFPDGILWVTLGVQPGNLVGKIDDLVYLLRRERPNFASPEAAMAKLREALAERTCLLVIDDVWHPSDLAPFLQGAPRCARLITTRIDQILPSSAQCVSVDAMRQEEAVQLLQTGLDREPGKKEAQLIQQLAKRLGEWPLLLALANGVLRERVRRLREPLPAALTYIQDALEKRGVVAFDARNAQERTEAVTRTVEVSLEQLSPDERMRFEELAIFPEDVTIPLATVHRLWKITGNLDELSTKDLCQQLYSFSLLVSCDLQTRSIRLHDVIRNYLQLTVRARLPVLHAYFLDAYALTRWADLSGNEPYLWDHLAYHLVAAGRLEELVATVKDLGYLAHKTLVRTVYATEADLAFAEQHVPADVPLRLLRRNFANMGHLLNRCSTFNDLAAVLYSRLEHLQELSDLCQEFEQDIPRPYLANWHPLPDLPDLALIRILRGHTGGVTACAISPAGDYIVSASYDNTLKVWDAHTREERRTLHGHTDAVNGCAISPAGDYIVSASHDRTLKVWDARTGEERRTLHGHTDTVNGCAISPAGDYIVSASRDQTLKVWDAHTGEEQRTLRGHRSIVNGCAISPAGDYIVSASYDRTLKVWDARTGGERRTPHGHTEEVYGCAISPAGDYIVSASGDTTLKVWDARTGEEQLTLRGDFVHRGCAISPTGDYIISGDSTPDWGLKVWDAHTGEERRTLCRHGGGVTACAISPAGDYIVSASYDNTLKVWDARTGEERRTLRGHTDAVNGCAISPAGDYIVSASRDQTLKVWDAHTGEEQRTLRGHTNEVNGCAISPAGDYIVSASRDQTLKVWDAHTGKERRTLRGHTGAVKGCAISPAGDFILSASADETLKVWDARTGVGLSTLYVGGQLNACAVHPDGEHIVAAGEGGVYFLRWVR
jgi:WD40 repeat protein